MELRTVNPRRLKFNPNNPRRTKATPEQDAQLVASLRKIGLLQPPVVRPIDNKLIIVAGERRVRCAIKAEMTEIPVLVRDADDGADAVRSFAENIVRAQMGPVDQWRAIEALIGDDWTEEAIAAAFAYPVRFIRRLRLLANIHPTILDHIAKGDMPREEEIRIIAAAALEEQAEIWKRHKPKRGETATWWDIARPLQKTRLLKQHARFDDDSTRRHGIVWEDDLFGPGDEDNLYTTQVDAFFAAQEEWLTANLPQNGVLLTVDQWGRPDLPPRAQRIWSTPGPEDRIGHYLDRRTGEVETVTFRLPPPKTAKAVATKGDGTTAATGNPLPSRPDVTQKGVTMIGDFRTDALHEALQESPADDSVLIGLLVLALAGQNVSVHSPRAHSRFDRLAVAGRLIEGGVLTNDVSLLRAAAREMLRSVLSCREGMTSSGMVARIAGDILGADRFLPNMATEEFLSCLSKAAIEQVARAENVLPRDTGKATRAALIGHVGRGTYLLPAARFALTEAERTKLQESLSIASREGLTDEDVDPDEAWNDQAEGTDEPDDTVLDTSNKPSKPNGGANEDERMTPPTMPRHRAAA